MNKTLFAVSISVWNLLAPLQSVGGELEDLCEGILAPGYAQAEESFRGLEERVRAEPALLDQSLQIPRLPQVATLAEFFVYLLRSPDHSRFHYGSIYRLLQGGREEWVRIIAVDPDSPAQASALSGLGLNGLRPLEDLYFSVVENLNAKWEARRAAVSAIRSRLYKLESPLPVTSRLLQLLTTEPDRSVAREITLALVFGGLSMPSELFEQIAAYCRASDSAYAPEMVWNLSVLSSSPEARLLFLELLHSPRSDVREMALRAVGRSRGIDAAGVLEDRVRSNSFQDRAKALRALGQLAEAGDEVPFLTFVRLFRDGLENGLALAKAIEIWPSRQSPAWFAPWAQAHLNDLGALLHAWVDLFSESPDRYSLMVTLEKVWSILPARNAEASLFSDLGLVWDETVSFSPAWRAGGLLFGSQLPASTSVRRVRAPTQDQLRLFHQKISEYLDYLKSTLES